MGSHFLWNKESQDFTKIEPISGTHIQAKKIKPEQKEALGYQRDDCFYVLSGVSTRALESWVAQKAGIVSPPKEPEIEIVVVKQVDWTMQRGTLLAAMALGRALTDQCHIALIWDSATDRVLAVGKHKGLSRDSWQTAIANALQNCDNLTQTSWCISSYKPTEMCIGMAHVLGVDLVWVEEVKLQSKVEYKIKPNNHGLTQQVKILSVPESSVVDPLVNPATFLANLTQLHTNGALNGSASKAIEDAIVKIPFGERFQPQTEVYDAFKAVPSGTASNSQYGPDYYLCLAVGLAGMCWSPKPHDTNSNIDTGTVASGNNVAAVLVHNGKIIGWGLNVLKQHPTFHAETVAIQVYLRESGKKTLPDGCEIYSSLQPCNMCAGFIAHVGRNAKVTYALKDRSLTTVLSENPPNGCSATLYNRNWLRTDLNHLRESVTSRVNSNSGGTTSVMFDKDVDRDYEAAYFGVTSQNRLRDLKLLRRTQRLDGDDFREMKQLERARDNPEKREALGALGSEFAGFCGLLMEVVRPRKENEPGYPLTAVKVAEQCLDLLTIAAAAGMSTRYGASIVSALFNRMGL